MLQYLQPGLRLVSRAAIAACATLAAVTLGAGAVIAQAPPEPPARFVGTVTLNGQPAPAGTPVEARVGSASCGVAAVFVQGGQSRYTIDVPGAASQPGCGTPDAAVTFLVGGVPAAQAGSWRNYELNQLDLTASSATPTVQPPATPTPRPPSAGSGQPLDGGVSSLWLASAALLASLAFVGMGWAAARR